MHAQVLDGAFHDLWPVPEIAKALVAVETQECANPAGLVVVVDMHNRRRVMTDGAGATLSDEHRSDIGVAEAVASHQVVMATAAIESLPSLATPGVMTRLAVLRAAVARTTIIRKLRDRLDLVAVGAVLEALRRGASPPTHARLGRSSVPLER